MRYTHCAWLNNLTHFVWLPGTWGTTQFLAEIVKDEENWPPLIGHRIELGVGGFSSANQSIFLNNRANFWSRQRIESAPSKCMSV